MKPQCPTCKKLKEENKASHDRSYAELQKVCRHLTAEEIANKDLRKEIIRLKAELPKAVLEDYDLRQEILRLREELAKIQRTEYNLEEWVAKATEQEKEIERLKQQLAKADVQVMKGQEKEYIPKSIRDKFKVTQKNEKIIIEDKPEPKCECKDCDGFKVTEHGEPCPKCKPSPEPSDNTTYMDKDGNWHWRVKPSPVCTHEVKNSDCICVKCGACMHPDCKPSPVGGGWSNFPGPSHPTQDSADITDRLILIIKDVLHPRCSSLDYDDFATLAKAIRAYLLETLPECKAITQKMKTADLMENVGWNNCLKEIKERWKV
jgi:hypothetical protein